VFAPFSDFSYRTFDIDDCSLLLPFYPDMKLKPVNTVIDVYLSPVNQLFTA
jgi:hypothetical protein